QCVEAVGQVAAAVLDQSVGVVEEYAPGGKPPVARGVGRVGGGAQHGPGRLVEVVDLPGAGGDERGQMPGVGVDQLAGTGIENGVNGGGERLRQEPGQGGVGTLQDLAGIGVVDRVGAEDATDLSHDRRRADAVAGHVADHQPDPVAVQGEGVVPVAPHVAALGGGQVTNRQVQPGDAGQG